MTADDPVDNLATIIRSLSLDTKGIKQLLRKLVADVWPELPDYSTLERPKITEVQAATVAAAVVPVFRENGIYKAVIARAGDHYLNRPGSIHTDDRSSPSYMAFGGFLNLTETPGSTHVPANPHVPENPNVGAIRELEEELTDNNGNKILPINPQRLKPIDSKVFRLGSGEPHAVIGFMVELEPSEVVKVKEHVARLKSDPVYHQQVRDRTINPESKKPEICGADIFALSDIAEGKYKFTHPDQVTLFQKTNATMEARVAGRY